MIQANELRIGNWFYYQHSDGRSGYAQVSIGKDIDLIKERSINAKPITITSKVLENCGFKKTNGSFSDSYEYFGFGFYLDDAMNCFSHRGCIWYGNEIKYLHQLQNLYFALTKNDLEYQT